MATLIGTSKSTVQAIETGHLKMSERLAERVSDRTAVSLAWLLNEDVTRPIVADNGEPYSRAYFEQRQASLRVKAVNPGDAKACDRVILDSARRLSLLINMAFGKKRLQLCAYKLDLALGRLEAEFGALAPVDRHTERGSIRQPATAVARSTL